MKSFVYILILLSLASISRGQWLYHSENVAENIVRQKPSQAVCYCQEVIARDDHRAYCQGDEKEILGKTKDGKTKKTCKRGPSNVPQLEIVQYEAHIMRAKSDEILAAYPGRKLCENYLKRHSACRTTAE